MPLTDPLTGANTAAIPPGSTIGILGGGQLGRMTAVAAAELGYRCHIFCPEAASPAVQVSAAASVAAYDDWAALEEFAAAVDVVTFEFENVPSATAAFLAERVAVRPGALALKICQNRLREKDFCNANQVPTTAFSGVASADGLARAVDGIGFPAVLKTTEMGYDGKGQVALRGASDLADAWQAMAGGQAGVEGIVEAFVDFRMEISVIVARGPDGALCCFDPVENRHKNHILDKTVAPAAIAPELAAEARDLACRLADAMQMVGLLAIEMFVTRDDRLLVNEMAPRPHNSGHWTQDACATSQFEQFVRAVCGLPLGSSERHANAVMSNLIGDDVEAWRDYLAEPGARLHLYGKAESRPGRKMGHVTRLFPKS